MFFRMLLKSIYNHPIDLKFDLITLVTVRHNLDLGVTLLSLLERLYVHFTNQIIFFYNTILEG